MENYTEYTVNRRVPDPLLRSYLYRNFPSVFVSSLEIDVTKRITEGNDLIILSQTANLEGVEYIIIKSGLQRKSRYLGSEVPTLFYVVCQTIGWSFKLFYF